MRTAPLLLAALLVCSATLVGAVGPVPSSGAGPVAGGAAPATGVVDADRSRNTTNESEMNETRVVAVPEAAVQRTTVRTYTVDVGPAVSFGANETTARIETAAVEERVASAATNGERRRQVLTALSAVEERTEQLDRRQQATIEAFNDGDISAREFVIRLAAIDAEAGALQHRLIVLDRLADDTDDFSLDSTRLAEVQFELRSLEGPVRERAADALRGDADSVRLFVETGPEGIVLSTVEEGTYLREAYRGALRDRSGTIAPDRALNVTSQSYPEIWRTRLADGVQATGSGTTYVVSVPHARGELTAFVDGGTGRVFKEYQRRPLDSYNNRTAAVTVKDGLQLVVNRTYPGGPLRVALWDADTGEPVDATITIGQGTEESTVLGTTGADGVIWTVSPRGQYSITAIKGQTSAVIVTTTPTEMPEAEVPD